MFDQERPDGCGEFPNGTEADPMDLVGLIDGASKALSVDPVLESADTLMAAAVRLEDLRNLVEGATVRVLAELEASGATDVALGMRTGSWLAWEADALRSRCRARVVVAKRLSWFGDFAAALVDRRVTYAHVEVLTSVANLRNRDGLARLQDQLIDLAARFSLEEWSQLVRRLAADLDEDGSYDPNEDLDANRLRVEGRDDGTADVAGRLTGDTACTVTQTLESVADELFDRFRRDHDVDPDLPMPTRATLLALALGEVCRRSKATDASSSRQPQVEATVIIDDHHDMLGDHGADRSGQGCRPAIRDLSGRPLSGFAAEVLLADPVVRSIVFDSQGVPLRLGRKVRLASADQRHALALRDGGCVFPGCDATPGWCDAHHQPAWSGGGPTDVDSMFLLCRHHHVVTHRQRWSCEPDPGAAIGWNWTTPCGRVIHSEHRRDRLRPTWPG